ncbi:MAG: hypothetical protein IH985_02735 [Planctomycetes bacterium]|nr:hypothetical protein [Planctomycetota bacterium]
MYLICHIVRDIYGKLPEALDADYHWTNPGDSFVQRVPAVAKHWKSPQVFANRPSAASARVDPATEVTISVAAARTVDELVKSYLEFSEQTRSAPALARVLYSRFAETGVQPPGWLTQVFETERRWFTGSAHLDPGTEKLPTDDELMRHFLRFENALHSLVAPYFAGKREIDEILQQANVSTPTNEQVESAVFRLSALHHQRYFFERLENPHWILPLKKLGLFKDPPGVEAVQDGGLRCRLWPQSPYLVRMASLAPDEVAAIFVEIETENWLVVHDMARAVKGMPAAIGARLASRLGAVIREVGQAIRLKDAGEIAAKWASEGQADSALNLFRAAFAVPPSAAHRGRRRQEDHWYFWGLDAAIPALASSRPMELIGLVAEWMLTALTAEVEIRGNKDESSDTWRPAIEDHEQNKDFDFAAKLLRCLRDACELAIREGDAPLRDVLGIIDARARQVFRRLHLHLLAEFGDVEPELAREAMLDRALLADYSARALKHEYSRLMSKQWGLFSPEQQQQWLAWVDEGPEAVDQNYYDEPDNTERTEHQRAYWQYCRLHWIREHLSGERCKQYKALFERFGESDLVDLNVYSGSGWYSPKSPYTIEQMEEMGFEQVITALRNWARDPSEHDFDAPSTEGLAGTFKQLAAKNPTSHSHQARLMEGVPAVYTRRFLEAMEEAVKEGTEIDLSAVIDLCQWVESQPPEERTSPEEAGSLIDPDWHWSRDTIASLIREIAKAEGDGGRPRFGTEYREALWEIVEPLLDSPAKVYVGTGDEKRDPRTTDWALVMLNSTRGKAMQALLAYAEWLANQEVPKDKRGSAFPGGFEIMKEVRACLERQLSREDQDFAGRAAFGYRASLLYWLDAKWLREHAEQIFDLRGIEKDASRAFGWAAWNTFLFSNHPHIEFYKMLRDQFNYAVQRAKDAPEPQRHPDNPFGKLAEHLIVLYGRGDLGKDAYKALDTDGGVIKRLVTQTSLHVRSHAVRFVGQSLSGENVVLPADVLARFTGLWDYYWQTVGREDAQRDLDENTFGYWFASEAFDEQWSIERLEEVVATGSNADPDDIVVRRLAEICPRDPLRSARIIQMLEKSDSEGWRVHGWKDAARKILETAMKDGGEARAVATATINRLGRRGFTDLGQLLDPPAGRT